MAITTLRELAYRYIKSGHFPNTLNHRADAEKFWKIVRELEQEGVV